MTLLKVYFLSISELLDEFAYGAAIIELGSLEQNLNDTGNLPSLGQQ